MKKLLIFSLLLGALVNGSQAQQGISGQVFVQQTVMGVQKGYGLRYTANRLGVGVVYQSSEQISFESSIDNYPFYGVEGLVKLRDCGDINVLFAPKIGMVNQQFLVIIPEVETQVSINRFITLGLGAGIRARQASTSFKLLIHPK
jgi:hypothetical protein